MSLNRSFMFENPTVFSKQFENNSPKMCEPKFHHSNVKESLLVITNA